MEIPVEGASIERESRFLCEKLCVYHAHGDIYEFAFEKGDSRLADEVARELEAPAGKKLEMAVAI